MTTTPPLPEPFDYCYEFDGPWGTRKFSPDAHNGRKPDRSVALFKASQVLEYGAPLLAEIERLTAELAEARAALEVARVDAERKLIEQIVAAFSGVNWTKHSFVVGGGAPVQSGGDTLFYPAREIDAAIARLNAAIDNAREKANG